MSVDNNYLGKIELKNESNALGINSNDYGIVNTTTEYESESSHKRVVSDTNTSRFNIYKPDELLKLNIMINVSFVDKHRVDKALIGDRVVTYPGESEIIVSSSSFSLYLDNRNKKDCDELVKTISEDIEKLAVESFKESLEEHLGEYNKLYDYDKCFTSVVYDHYFALASTESSSETRDIKCNLSYRYIRNPDILVREDDVIHELLTSFKEVIKDKHLIDLDELVV